MNLGNELHRTSVNARSFMKESIRFEKKKVILPALMVFLLLSTVLYGFHLRSQGWDEEMTDLSYKEFKLNILKLSEKQIENSSQSIRSIDPSATRGIENQKRDLAKKIPLRPFSWGLAYTVQYTDVFPLTPSASIEQERTFTSISLPADTYLSKERTQLRADKVFLSMRANRLVERAIEDNMTLKMFKTKFDLLERYRHPDPRLVSYFDDKLESYERKSDMPRKYLEEFSRRNIREAGLIYFLPSVIGTFLLYYLISGVVITGYRRQVSEAEGLMSEHSIDISTIFVSTAFVAGLSVFLILLQSLLTASLRFDLLKYLLALEILAGIGYIFTLRFFQDSNYLWFKMAAIQVVVVGAGMQYVLWEPGILQSLGFTLLFSIPSVMIAMNCWGIQRRVVKDLEN